MRKVNGSTRYQRRKSNRLPIPVSLLLRKSQRQRNNGLRMLLKVFVMSFRTLYGKRMRKEIATSIRS